MYKIKLLILLLCSFFIISCAQDQLESSHKFKLKYIGGKVDGYHLSRIMNRYLKINNIYDENSLLTLNAKIDHEEILYAPNIDNTSDRALINSNLYVEIFDLKKNCILEKYNFNEKQFYLIASSQNNISNQNAFNEIKINNTETMVKDMIDSLMFLNAECVNEV